MESALITTPLKASPIATARSDFPLPVAPPIIIAGYILKSKNDTYKAEYS